MIANEITYISGSRVFKITWDAMKSEGGLRITCDAEAEWAFSAVGWGGISFGHSGVSDFVWTARTVIRLPRAYEEAPEELAVDEDLLLVFEESSDWILVCETSVRVVRDRQERARLELNDTIETASWDRGLLAIKLQGHMQVNVSVVDGALEAIEQRRQ